MIIAFYHHPLETMGLIKNVLDDLHLQVQEIHLYKGESLPSSMDCDGLIVMGGPMSVLDSQTHTFLPKEISYIQQTIQENKPILGVCLGAQIIASACNASVVKNSHREVGWYPISKTKEANDDPLFHFLPNEINVFHWHGETFELPKGAVHLASSSRCSHQAFRYGTSTYGIQFHFEVTGDMIKKWCGDKMNEKYIQEAGERKEDLLATTPKFESQLRPLALSFFNSYFRRAYQHVITSKLS